jgi:hypothetical protein
MKRLFAFGCSLTYYSWPTWADLVSQEFDQYYNFGVMGCGNQFIQFTVFEADALYSLTSSDTVLIMTSSPFRNDTFTLDEHDHLRWQSRGYVHQPNNANIYTDEWLKNFWSGEQGYMVSWLALKSITHFLINKGIKFKIVPGFAWTHNGHPTECTDVSFIQPYVTQIEEYMHVKTPIYNWAKENYSDEEFLVVNGLKDDHPTVKMHGRYVKEFLPEYYTKKIADSIDFLDSQICTKSSNNNWCNPHFRKIQGIKSGSVANWQQVCSF